MAVTLSELLPPDAREFMLDRPEGALSLVRIAARTGDPASAPTAVLVPGFTGSKEDFFPILGPLADRGFNVVAFSQRGQSHSSGPGAEPPTDADGYDLEALGRDVHWLLDELNLTAPVHLLGHSFGGLVAIEALLQNPAQFASFTLWNSGPRAARDRSASIDAVRRGGGEALWRLSNPGQDPERIGRVERWFYDRMLRTRSAQLLGALNILSSQNDRVDEIATTGVRVLVAHGANDDAWPHAWQREVAERTGGRYVVIPDAGHNAQVDQPAASAAVLATFWHGVC